MTSEMEAKRYIATGVHDPLHAAWPGRNVAEYARKWVPEGEGLNRSELVEVLAEAVEARNGWKRILGRCGPKGCRTPDIRRVPLSTLAASKM
jgi:hypothetical protein